MNRYIKSIENKYLEKSAQLVAEVFTESEGEESGQTVKQLVLEIRNKRFYLPVMDNRMILGIAKEKELDVVDALLAAYNSFVSEKINDYNSSFYYDAPQNILNSFLYGEIE